ncbi:MAG: hypothetical protein QF859_00455 [Candidatus Marinimicrobia bacterium]|jgi:hypothetical protein|nr:hypothetical protein [Candidatus Neomarinimicrobiota bacterium]MDP6142655.1 hypothetical protein [Candidatus Neomarinimicrobiota bacterium]MDP6261351.1 hypothetical protein [Candidatus Neomarinimicrobiota bacterium]MDP7127772.1 hypothetical protein [Candidatus Neomarinimicrobiota bacterium]MDP7336497.1 hypothetical protein [Candidatus Neomarinimicrobiota bacterium]|tara:strand:+ start:56 stop:520 length:465 start_codon:yes stop_codon:yes gene_type:complete
MNRALIICGILFTVASQLIAQSGTAVGRQTAKNGEKVWLVINKIKFDKKQEFDKILFGEVMPAAAEYRDKDDEKHELNKKSLKTIRILRPTQVNDDSTWTFLFIADPYIEGATYNIGPPLLQKYGEDGAQAVFNRWSDCFAAGQEVYLNEQSDW